MMNPHATTFLPFQRLLADERRRQATDRDLLQIFVQHTDHDAFAELLRRHGPMVLHLALHLLNHRQDAEDVFQATFLTLARKAHALRKESSVAAWLHRVAWRLALRCRKRRAAGVSRLMAINQPADAGRSPEQEISLREAQALLHEELAALPERLRQPLVLCYLQGQTRDEAARRLGWSLGTLKRRLEQGRKLLQARLSRRGLTLSAALSASLLMSEKVSASLAKATVRLATSAVAGSASMPASVAILMAETAWSAKAKALCGLVLLLGLCSAAAAWVYREPTEDPAAPAKRALPSQPPVAGKVAGPARDRFGDSLPAGAVARLGTVRLRHGDYLRSMGFAPDGKSLISMGNDGVRVWEAATGKPVRHFGAGVSPWSIDLSSDGRRVALSRHYAGEGGPVEVWNVATGKLTHKLTLEMGPRHYSRVRISPDGKQLAAYTGESIPGEASVTWNIAFWDAETGRDIRTLTGPKEYIWDMKFSGDGKTILLAGADKSISVRRIADGKEVRRLRNLPANVHTLIPSPSGDRIAFIESWIKKWDSGQINWGPGTQVFLVNSQTGAELRRWSVTPKYSSYGLLENGWWSIAFSPDGRRLAACQKDGPVHIWDTATREEKRLLLGGRQHNGGVAFSPDGKTLAVGEGGRSIRFIDAKTGADRLSVPGHRGSVTALAASGNGGTIFTAAEEGTIYCWDARSGREIGRLTGHTGEVPGLALAGDGRTLFSTGHDGTLRLWDLRTGKDRRLLENESLSWNRLVLSPDGKTLAVPFINYKDLRLFNATTGECLHRLTTKTRIIDIAFSADGSIVKALTGDHTVWRWELPSGRRLPDEVLPPDRGKEPYGNPHAQYQEVFALSPDGRLAAHGDNDRFLRVVELSTHHLVQRSTKLPGALAKLAFAPDGRTLAWAEHSGVIHWLELATWSERRTFAGHAGAVTQLIFTADGKHLVSGAGDTTSLVWDLIGSGPASLSAAEREACWTALAEKDAVKAYRSLCRLIAAPADAIALLGPRLKPAASVDERRIEDWVRNLDADAFGTREKATEELRKIGELAEPALRKSLAARPTLEKRRRLQNLLDDIAQQQWQPTPEILRQSRAVEVLERLGTPEARKVLESLAGGAAGARLTREAGAAEQRLLAQRSPES